MSERLGNNAGDDLLIQNMRDLLDTFASKKIEDETVLEFSKNTEGLIKVLPSEYDDTNNILYKGNKIVYISFESEGVDEIMDYIKNSSDDEKYLEAFKLLLSNSVILVNSSNPDKVEVYKPQESEFTVLDYIVKIEKEFTEKEITEIIYCIYINELYINGNLEEAEWLKAFKEINN